MIDFNVVQTLMMVSYIGAGIGTVDGSRTGASIGTCDGVGIGASVGT